MHILHVMKHTTTSLYLLCFGGHQAGSFFKFIYTADNIRISYGISYGVVILDYLDY